MQEAASNPDVKEANLNRSQALIQIINPNVLYHTAPRASGKTSGGIGPRILHLSEKLPRAQIGIVADTFERIDKTLLPGIEAYWNEELGLLPDIDYVMHKRPPDHWTKPLFVPKKYDHVTTFASGLSLCEISLSVPGSGNGFNLQALIGDEVKYWDEQKFKSEVKPAIRGGRKHFGHLPEFQSQWFFSDKFPSKGADIGWVLKKKKDVDWAKVDIVYTLQLEVFRLRNEQAGAGSDSAKYRLQQQIDAIEETLRQLRIDLVYYCDAQAYENKDVLGDKYFRDQKRDLSKYEYEVAIENKDPDKAIEPFYPSFTDVNLYNVKNDVDVNKALIIALDYQHNIIPIVTAQFGRLPGSPYTTLNFVSSLHALGGGFDAALALWLKAHAGHREKMVYYVYDHTAVAQSPYGKTFKDKVCDILVAADWAVVEVYCGKAPNHEVKHEPINKWLLAQGDKAIRMNEAKNEYLKKSIEKTDAILVSGKTKKDKSSERSKKVPPEEATHYCDTFDQIVWGVLEMELVPMTDEPGMDISTR